MDSEVFWLSYRHPLFKVVQDDSGEEWIFPQHGERMGADVSDKLCEFLFSENHRGMFIVAHNLRVRRGFELTHREREPTF